MKIYEIRRRNFWALVHPNGYDINGIKQCAEKMERSEIRIRHLIATSPDRDTAKVIGDPAALHIEKTYKKPEGWLDVPHIKLWQMNIKDKISLEGEISGVDTQTIINELSQDSGVDKNIINLAFKGESPLSSEQEIDIGLSLSGRQGGRFHIGDSSEDYARTNEHSDIVQRIARLSASKIKKVEDYLTFIENASE